MDIASHLNWVIFLWVQATLFQTYFSSLCPDPGQAPESHLTADTGCTRPGPGKEHYLIIPGGMWWPGTDIIGHCQQMDLTLQGLPSEPESRISCSVHAVYADCMQWVHPAAIHAAVHWAEEKLSIYLQHLIPQHCNHAAVCSESLQIMWEHNTLSLNFHLIISWVRSKMKNFHAFFSISITD